MKRSNFNIMIPSFPVEGESLIYNTFSDSRIIIDRYVIETMEKAVAKISLSEKERRCMNELRELGVMVDDDVDERRELEYWFQRLKFDTSIIDITLLTSYACNLACTYCYEKGIGSTISMGKEVLKKVVLWLTNKMDEVRPGSLRITFFGGEPLLNMDIVRSISEILYYETRKRRIEIGLFIVTNGTLITKGVIESLLPFGLKGIKVTLDGDREFHDSKRIFRDGRGTFDIIVRNLLEIKGLLPITIGGNFDDKTKEGIPLLLDRLLELDFDGNLEMVRFKPIFSSIEEMKISGLCKGCRYSDTNIEDILWVRREVIGRGFRTGNDIVLGPCEAIREYSYTIDPIGRIYKCPGFVGREEFVIGDLYNDRFLYRNTEFMTADIWRMCGRCPYIPICGGGCRASAYISRGDFMVSACEKRYFEDIGIRLIKEDSTLV